MDVERKGDGEGGDVSNQRGPRFAREKRERVRGENERNSFPRTQDKLVVNTNDALVWH